MEREIQTMRNSFLGEFQSADSARSTALYKHTRATKEIISIMSTFRDITQFDISLHHYTAYMYIAQNGKFKPCGSISWKNFKVRTARDRQPYKGPYKGHQRYNLYNFYFPRYNPVWYSFAPLYSVYVYSKKRGDSNHADLFLGWISKCGQRAIDSPKKGLQGPQKI